MNPASTDLNDSARFDVREISCREKHGLIFARWADLAIGGHFILINDHDPVPLYYQFAGMFPDAFSWEYLQRGPEQFQIKITRLAASSVTAAVRPPGGSCGGHH